MSKVIFFICYLLLEISGTLVFLNQPEPDFIQLYVGFSCYITAAILFFSLLIETEKFKDNYILNIVISLLSTYGLGYILFSLGVLI